MFKTQQDLLFVKKGIWLHATELQNTDWLMAARHLVKDNEKLKEEF